jgi:hypothetical protein
MRCKRQYVRRYAVIERGLFQLRGCKKGRLMVKPILKWTAIVGAALILIKILAMLLIPRFVDVARFKPLIEERVSKTVGRPFSVGDDVRLALFPWAALTLTDLRMGNSAEFSEKEAFSNQSRPKSYLKKMR